MAPIARKGALRTLADGHTEVRRLIDRIGPGAAIRPGLGGGEWSPKDLLGHLTSWEEYALAAMGAWRDGRTAPIDQALRELGLGGVNRRAVAMKADRSLATILREFDDVHGELVDALGAVPVDVWDAPPTTRSRRSLGERVGSILGGPGGLYRHADAHLPSLRGYVDQHGRR